jgi:hypothetical protein
MTAASIVPRNAIATVSPRALRNLSRLAVSPQVGGNIRKIKFPRLDRPKRNFDGEKPRCHSP